MTTLLLLLLASQPLKVYPEAPPMALTCAKGTAAVEYDKDNVEHVACYEHLKCEDGTGYGSGSCACKPGMPLLNQNDVVAGCTAKAVAVTKKG